MMRAFGLIGPVVMVLLVVPVGGFASPDQQTPSEQPAAVGGHVADEAPAMTPAEAEAARLGRAFGGFDRSTWEMVGDCWTDGETCVQRLAAHMQEHRGELKQLLATADAVRCESKGQGKVSIQVSEDAVGESYRKAYAAEVSPVESIRYGNGEEPEREAFLRQVRSMERTFRMDLCQEILDDAHKNRYQPKQQPGDRAQKRETAVF